MPQSQNIISYLSSFWKVRVIYRLHDDHGKYLYLDDFSVTAACRGKGIGSALIRTAEAYAAEDHAAAVLLHVDKTNSSAMRLYERSGYSVYRDDYHRYLMKKDNDANPGGASYGK